MEGANISIHDGKITSIYSGNPRSARLTIDASGRVATAGLWNSHVHLTDPRFLASSESMLRDVFLKYGFTTIIDTGSELSDTLALKKKIEEGNVLGPRIVTANGSFVYTNGTPSYLPGVRLPEIERPEQAESMVAAVLDAGADGIKIFSGSFQSERDTIHLPPRLIRAIVDAAHSRRSFVFSHPTDKRGVVNAVESGVDVLAHTAPLAGPFGPELVDTMRANDVALIPTLKLWRLELLRAGADSDEALAFQGIGVRQLSEYFAAGGEILFGTDVGFIEEFDTAEEYRLMGAAGMKFEDILASATTSPASRFLQESGRLGVGAPADIVIYENSPLSDVANLARVAYTIRAGQIAYRLE